MPESPASPQLFSLRLPNDAGAARVALAAVTAQLRELAFAPADIERLQVVVEEACTNVLKHAYRPDQRETFDVECSVELGKLKIRVRDHGLPYDPYHAPQFLPDDPHSKGLGLYLMQRLVHELRFVNLGHNGKAVDLLYTLPGGWAQHPHETHTTHDTEPGAAPNPSDLRVRLFQPDDAGQVARCAYRVYGYSYFGEHVYIPERLIAMNAGGQLTSAVVVDDQDRVFGHLALVFSSERVIPEEGQAFVMPEARGGGWFKRLKQFLYDEAQRRGLPGVFSDGVTVHPYTQKANLAMNSRECGLLLAFAPGNVQFNDLHQADDHRHSLVVFYKPLESAQRGRAYLPRRHRAMIQEIFANVDVALEELSGPLPLAPQSVIDTVNNAARGIAYLTIRQYGADLVEQLRHQQRLLGYHGAAVIQLDLPMNHPAAAEQCEAIEALGFFFCGVVPHYFGGAPSLRFQCLNNVEVDVESIVLESPFAKRLFSYVLQGVKQ